MMFCILNFIISFFSIIILSLLISNNPAKIRIRFIAQILIIEIFIGYITLHSQIGINLIQKLCYLFETLLFFAAEGTDFIFGGMRAQGLAQFFLNILCPIIFISSLIAILQYSRILILIIKIIGTILSKINGMSKLESFNAISSLIFGQSENFIIYKKIIEKIPESKIYSMAATAMSTTSISIISIYMTFLIPKYVITAIVLNIFSAFIIISIVNPCIIDSDQNIALNNLLKNNQSLFEIIGEYILTGFKIATTIAAMLIGFISLIAAFNAIFKTLCGISLQEILSYFFFPFACVMGIPNQEALKAGEIIATKIISNEFVAMIKLQKISNTLSSQSIGILSVFLVSFSNLSSIGIIIGTIKKLNKNQGKIISRYGFKLIYTSILINMLSASITGLIL